MVKTHTKKDILYTIGSYVISRPSLIWIVVFLVGGILIEQIMAAFFLICCNFCYLGVMIVYSAYEDNTVYREDIRV
jgi:hypothetical protein